MTYRSGSATTAPPHRVVAKGRGGTGPFQKTHEAECSDITWCSGRHRVQKLSRARPALQGRPRCPRQPRRHLQRADLRYAGSATLPQNPPPSRTPATSPLLGKHTTKAQFRTHQEATAAALLLVLLHSPDTPTKRRTQAQLQWRRLKEALHIQPSSSNVVLPIVEHKWSFVA